jgi:NAD(P)-dependent dehydrogenase (short-subunit alcohol dehydrogenase family)
MAATKTNKSTRQKKTTKVAIVTGGGTGLGRDMANRLARDGFAVAILGRRADRLKPKKSERGLHPYVCDVADREQILSTVKAIRGEFGRIDAVVNNAGVMHCQTWDKLTDEMIHYHLNVNLIGTMNMCLACIPALKRTRGSIINISSSLTDRCAPSYLAYSASKGGVNAWSKTMAMELCQWGIRVNVINPSLVRSEIVIADGASPEAYEQHLKVLGETYFPMGRSGEPEDVSAIASYLASDESTWMTGQILTIDGGEAVGFKRW